MTEKNTQLKRELGLIDVWGLALGAIIGWGCFVLPGTSFLPKAGPLGTAFGLALGAGIIMLISLSYGYLIRKYPVSGGEYIYVRQAFGNRHAFVCGWFIVLAYWSLIPLNATAIAMIARFIFPGVIQVGKLYSVAGWDVYLGEIAVASAFIIIIGIINITGAKFAGRLQSMIAILLVASIIIVTVGVSLTGPDFGNLKPEFSSSMSPLAGIFAVVAYAPYCFIGFDCIPQSAEEYKFSHRKSIVIMIVAIAIAALLYISVSIVTAVVEPWQDMLAGEPLWATGSMIEKALGKPGVFCIGIAMLCAVTSGINAFYLSTSRLMYAMANEKALAGVFGELDKKHATPKKAIFFCMILALIAPWFGRQVLVWITDMTAVGGAMAFCYTTAAAGVLAKRNGDKGQSILGYVGCLAASIFLILSFVPGMPGFLSVPSFICLFLWIGAGIVAYWKREK